MDLPTTRSARAMAKALEEIGPCHPKTAAVLMFFAAVSHLREVAGQEKAAELTYAMADELVTGGWH